jgi:CubicO group peptidase (beta-lactamase class C family)
MISGQVPGVAAAVIRDGKLDRYLCRGVRHTLAPAAINEHTVFDAASLSKPVFALTVLPLVDSCQLELQSTLSDHLPEYLSGDLQASLETSAQKMGQLEFTAFEPARYDPNAAIKLPDLPKGTVN